MPRVAAVSARNGRAFRSLRHRSEFSRIYQEGKRRRKGDVTVVVAPGAPGSATIGFVAGKRVGNAVRRNRAKRRLRAAMEQLSPTAGNVYIVIAGPGVVEVDFLRLVGWLKAVVEDDPPGEGRTDE